MGLKPAPDTSTGSTRRDFLLRCCQGLSAAAFLPAGLRGRVFEFSESPASPGAEAAPAFQLHPHYRAERPIDALLLKANAALDHFPVEQYADQVSAILDRWSAGLRQSPPSIRAIQDVLTADFRGTQLGSGQMRAVHPGPVVRVEQWSFDKSSQLAVQAFVQGLASYLAAFSEVVTAEFQITGIEFDAEGAGSAGAVPQVLNTRIRYELVGSGKDFHRQQRVGHWDLVWEPGAGSDFRVREWRASEETRSTSFAAVFEDISTHAFENVPSYSAQLLHGADYWRTVLDSACGIDIYGHNGIAAGDIDNDGFDDLYVCQPGGLPNRLYRNRGDGSFEDITESAGVGILENTACALFADINNDGLQDLVVVRTGGPLLFLNQGGGRFRARADAFQFATPPQGTFTGAALADYDRDGWLDIYFCLYLYYQGTGQYKYPSPYYDANNGPPNFLLRNNRDGTFRDVTAQAGLDQNNRRYSFCCGWNDYNGDGWPDLYVVNDFGRKNLYRNNGDGTFTDVAAELGVEDVGAGMGVGWFDYDNDGAEDLYVANMWTAAGERISAQKDFQQGAQEKVRAQYRKHAMGNSLFRNAAQTDASFRDVTAVSATGMGRWSWSSDAWDFDHDGFPDLYVTNGMISGPRLAGEVSTGTSNGDLNSFFWRQVVANSPTGAKPAHAYEQGWDVTNELIRSDATWSGYERNVFFANNRDGTFSDVSGAIGLDFLEDGRAFALADFDHDGRLEVLLKNRNAPQLRVLKNMARELPPAISFCLRGTKSNRDAIGAVVTIQTEAGRQTRTLQAGSGFLSQHSKEIFFGLGGAKGRVEATIRWPSGALQEVHDLQPNHRVWVEEGSPPTRMEAFASAAYEKASTGGKNNDSSREVLPATVETWLLAPIAAPDFPLPSPSGEMKTLSALRGKPALLHLWATAAPESQKGLETLQGHQQRWAARGLSLVSVNLDDPSDPDALRALVRQHGFSFPIVQGSSDFAATWSILYRYLFDRHRDLSLPTAFLINESGEIVKVYQGAIGPGHLEHDLGQIPKTSAERMARALPFPGIAESLEFRRNYLSYGSVYFQRELLEPAAAAFQMALRDDPESAEALYGLGSVFLKQNKSAEAREAFQQAAKLQASYPGTPVNIWNNLGLLDAREGRTDEAIANFQHALELDSDYPVALVNVANAYRQQRRWTEARQALERALAINAEDAEANYSLGMVYAQLDDSVHAYEYLERALKARPDYPEALNNLGVLYLRTGRSDEAVAQFESCMRVAPQFDQAYLNLARVYALEGASEKARAVLAELLKRQPGHTVAKQMLEKLAR